jgi:RsiW-degrading membrane proteinase PrsW (M82 family)
VLILVVSVAAASLPTLIYAAVLRRLSLDKRPARWLLVSAVGWGSAGGVVIGLVWTIVLGRPFELLLRLEDFTAVESVFLAPLAEELAKAVFFLILLRRGRMKTALMGLVFGIGVGVGFALTENAGYYLNAWFDHGYEGWATTVMVRTLCSSVVHAGASGLWGAFLGHARSSPHPAVRWVFPYAGLVGAVVMHGSWNLSLLLSRVSGSDIPITIAVYTVLVIVALMMLAPAEDPDPDGGSPASRRS